MEEIKAPKKEKKFLKAVGNIAKVLANELVMGIARKFIGKAIDKVGNKKQGLVIAFLLVAGISYASIDSIPYPVTGNKQRLGWQTSGNGLVYRGHSNDTITKPSSYVDKNVKAYLLLDSVRGTIFVWRQTYWDSILVGGGSFAQPIDSLFFDTSVPTNNVDTAKMRWDSDLATVVLGLNDNVPNELGFKNFWLVKNQTGSTITKGSIVYANGTVGSSGRITVAKFIANGSIDAKYLLGITAHDLSNGEDGYVISYGKIRQVNTDTFAAGAILYPSPTVAGVWTDVEPIAPNIDMPIGFCINSSVNNGTIAIRVASGYKLSELHDVAISSPVDKASLYYSGGLWRDTTAALLVSDTASMLTPYLRKADTSLLNLTSRFVAKLNLSDTASMLTNYLRSGVAASTYQTKLTNPVTGTGTNNYIPKFTTTGSTIGNSTLIDNGSTISTSSVLSTTNYASFNTTQVMSNSSGILSTHRFTSANANGVYDKNWFLTSYMGAPWQGSDIGSGNRSKPPIVAIINNTDSNLINSGLHLMTTKSQNNVYTPALTFGVNSENGVYYNTIGAITAKKLNTGQFTSQSAGQLEFFGTGTALDITGASMTTANMTLGVGVGIGYTTAPTVRGRLTVLEKLGINQSTPNFALDVNGTANITGATTLGSTLAVTGDITENGLNVLTSGDTTSMLLPYLRDADTVTLSNRINLKLNIADTSAFARDNQISGTSGQVTYFNSSNSVISDAGLIYNATNKLLGINTTTTSGANLIIKNSQEPVRDTFVGTQTFTGTDTLNWTRGTGWTFDNSVAVATAASGDLTYTPSLTVTSGNAYEIRYTIASYSSGTLTASIGNASLALPTHNATANVILLLPTIATGGFRFTTSLFTGNLNNITVVEISNAAPVLFAGQDDGAATLYNSLRMPNSTTLAFGGGGARTTGAYNNFMGFFSGNNNTSGSSNNFFGLQSGQFNTSGNNNNFIGFFSGNLNSTGSNNNFMGNESGRRNTTGINNNFYGNTTGANNTTGSANNFFGGFAGLANTTGNSNNFFGNQAGVNNTTGNANNFFGAGAGVNNISGNDNNFFGSEAGTNNRNGIRNNFFGINAGRSNTTGSSNVAIGNAPMYNTTVGDTLTGSNNIAIGTNAGDNIEFAAANNLIIGNGIDLPIDGGSNQVAIKNVYFATDATGAAKNIAALSKAGIKTATPNRDLEVAGEVRITDLTTDAPTRLVGADADGDLGQVTLGAGISLASSSLLADTNFLVTRFDTASMLTNYLRTGTAASTYLTQSNAALTYLPLTGGTLTGGLTGTTGSFITNNLPQLSLGISGITEETRLAFVTGNIERFKIFSTNSQSSITFQSPAQESAARGYRFISSWNADSHLGLVQDPRGNVGIKSDATGNDVHPNTLYVNGTLGVTGATTLSAPLTVNSSAVFNEGSAIADFRVESDGNANMLFVDGTNNRVGIGYASPTKTLDVNGEVRINTLTATPTSLLGKDGSNVVGTVTLGNTLTLTSGTLNVNNKITDINTSSYTIVSNDFYIDNFNSSTTTITLPSAASNTYRELKFHNRSTGALNSSPNVISLTGSSTSSILSASSGKWATLVSDGTDWRIMQAN